MSAFDELERQLLESVAARRRVRASAFAGIGRWWRARAGHGDLLVAVPLVLVVVAAAAGTHMMRVPHAASLERAPRVARVASAEAPCGPCQAVSGRLHAPLSEAASQSAGAGQGEEARDRRGLPAVRWAAEAQTTGPSVG